MAHAALLISQPDGSVRELALAAEPLVIGRDPACDLPIDGRLISRRHAAIRRSGQIYLLEDLGSRNGTSVNGAPIAAPHPLRDGDRIGLGGVEAITFVDGDATATRPAPPARGVYLDSATQGVWVDGLLLDPPLSSAQFSMLQALAARAGQICTRDDLVAAIWPEAAGGISDEALDALLKRVRARLAAAGGAAYLVTLRGRGLMLRAPHDPPR
jgi:DNA-binding response OmpR family regulator